MPRAAAAADRRSRSEAVGPLTIGIPSPRTSRAFCCPPVRPLDVAVIAAYCVAVVVFGLVLAGRQRDASDYFLGHRGLPWWALMLSIVATETSALTVISIPGIAARGDLTFLHLTFGYLVGRIGVATLLLLGYFEGTQETAYQRLERRFVTAARRTASGAFLLTRALADCVRIFATAIPLAIITHWSFAAGILAIGIAVAKIDRKSTRLNSSHSQISYAVFCLKKKKK